MPRMATLNNSHSANPGRSYHRAHFEKQLQGSMSLYDVTRGRSSFDPSNST